MRAYSVDVAVDQSVNYSGETMRVAVVACTVLSCQQFPVLTSVRRCNVQVVEYDTSAAVPGRHRHLRKHDATRRLTGVEIRPYSRCNLCQRLVYSITLPPEAWHQ